MYLLLTTLVAVNAQVPEVLRGSVELLIFKVPLVPVFPVVEPVTNVELEHVFTEPLHEPYTVALGTAVDVPYLTATVATHCDLPLPTSLRVKVVLPAFMLIATGACVTFTI